MVIFLLQIKINLLEWFLGGSDSSVISSSTHSGCLCIFCHLPQKPLSHFCMHLYHHLGRILVLLSKAASQTLRHQPALPVLKRVHFPLKHMLASVIISSPPPLDLASVTPLEFASPVSTSSCSFPSVSKTHKSLLQPLKAKNTRTSLVI